MKYKMSLFFILFIGILLPFQSFAESCPAKQCIPDCKGFTAVAKKIIPAVVFIRSQYTQAYNYDDEPAAEDYENPFDYFNDEFFRRFFGTPGRPGYRQAPPPPTAGGSGFLISSDGKIVTNYHVVKDATTIIVTLNTGEEKEAKLIGTDPRTDLAVLQIEGQNLPYLKFANSDTIEVGDWAIAVGSPFALQSSLTVGVISAKGRQDLRITDLEDFLQTDAAINPGNSGGPLCDVHGDVGGVNAAIVSKNGGYMGVGFAIPGKIAEHVVEQILQNGQVKRGYLGVYMQQVDKEIAEAFNLEKPEGVLIAEVIKDSPAEKAGIKQGDIILEYNDLIVKNLGSFRNDISLLEPGTKIKLKILRSGKPETFFVTLVASPEKSPLSIEKIPLGIEVSDPKDISPELARRWGYSILPRDGVVIMRIKPGSLAEKAGLRPGIFILQLNQKSVHSPEEFYEELNKVQNRKHFVFLIRLPNNTTRFLTIRNK